MSSAPLGFQTKHSLRRTKNSTRWNPHTDSFQRWPRVNIFWCISPCYGFCGNSNRSIGPFPSEQFYERRSETTKADQLNRFLLRPIKRFELKRAFLWDSGDNLWEWSMSPSSGSWNGFALSLENHRDLDNCQSNTCFLWESSLTRMVATSSVRFYLRFD